MVFKDNSQAKGDGLHLVLSFPVLKLVLVWKAQSAWVTPTGWADPSALGTGACSFIRVLQGEMLVSTQFSMHDAYPRRGLLSVPLCDLSGHPKPRVYLTNLQPLQDHSEEGCFFPPDLVSASPLREPDCLPLTV